MSEKILKALMQLFAIIANVDDVTNKSRGIVEQFLKQRLSRAMVEEYITYYDEFLEAHHKISRKKEGQRKKTSLNSVKVLRICTQINEELTQRQKIFVLIRIIEYVYSDKVATPQELEFVQTVSEVFNIPDEELNTVQDFITAPENNVPDSQKVLIISKQKSLPEGSANKHIGWDTMSGKLIFLNIESVGIYGLRYFGQDELFLNGQIISPERTYILTPGSSIRSTKVNPIYYSDIISKFLTDQSESKIIFSVDHIEYEFKGGKKGLHPLTFSEETGKLIGIMGASGAGKSTLLNVLNGNYAPTSGSVKINGLDIHHQKDSIEGMIGYVSQDDLLIDALTVFQNLFNNAKLCFDGHTDAEITEMVIDLLKALGLHETRDLKVGSPLEKTISGGQRKRLNIALELIREPSVLFVDEPTSGLSSRDSENIMDLLKELALKGKQVFVVIHQPSSEIFKMFDKLLILDTGGFPIYYGNPLDAVIYFKTATNQINNEVAECRTCGNVNPEQIFNIIEAKVIDEYGNQTINRKVSPQEWCGLYRDKEEEHVSSEKPELPSISFKTPNWFNQFRVFIKRDIQAKLANQQYLLINLLEAPVLALLLSYFLRYFDSAGEEAGYVFFNNDNLPAYMFIAVIVALFLGLTVSAEEIFKDQKIRKRESFLNLSNSSYLVSKITIMFFLSAIQTLSFLLIGNLVLGINTLFFDYWLLLFSTACFANMLGLNISASFNSAVTIYIIIPFLIIPQILFSGVIVKFENLNPLVTSQTEVPMIGEVMASRWAFEALAVNQYKSNEYERKFYMRNKRMSRANFQRNYWIPALKGKITKVRKKLDGEGELDLTITMQLLQNEIGLQNDRLPKASFERVAELTTESVDEELLDELDRHLDILKRYYNALYNDNSDKKDALIVKLQSTEKGKEEFVALRNNNENESLSELVTNKNEFNQIAEYGDRVIQRADPVYLDPQGFSAHFYAPRKRLFGVWMDTFWANTLVLWFMSIILGISLYFDGMKKLLNLGEVIASWFPKKKA